MNKIRLGATDIEINELGVGAWSWGDTLFWQFGTTHTEQDIYTAIDATLAAGIDFFDTAEVYGFGKSEIILGGYVRAKKSSIVTATKFMPYPWRLRKSSAIQAMRKSLERLQMERVDLYQVHQALPPQPPEHWMAAMADVARAGLTRGIGVSNYNAEWTRRAHAALTQLGYPLATNQLKYSLLDRHIERDGTMKACQELNITVIAYSPIEMGLLTGKYTPTNPVPGIRGRRYNQQYVERIQPLISLMREMGQAHGGKTPSQIALNWTLCKGTVPIPGAKNARQAQENAGAMGWRLTSDEVAALEQASDKVQR